MTKHDAIDPPWTSTSTGHRSEFLSDVDESITEFAVQLGRERASTHASRVRLRDADDPVEKARSEAGTRARAAGSRIRRRDVRIRSVIEIEECRLRTFE